MNQDPTNSRIAGPGGSNQPGDPLSLKRRLRHLELELDLVEKERARLQTDMDAILQSRTWRWGLKIALLLRTIRRLPKRLRSLYWKPSMTPKGVAREAKSRWQALDDNPGFEAEFEDIIGKPLWYKFKLFGEDDTVSDQGCLYFDYGEGYSEDDVLRFSSFGPNGTALIRLTRQPARIRFDPVEQVCTFSFSTLGYRRISRLEALLSYVLLYLKRQRQADVSYLAAIQLKIAQLGGWRNLRWSNLSGHIQSHQVRVTGNSSADHIVSDYCDWISDYEQPFMSARYDRPRSMGIFPVLISAGQPGTPESTRNVVPRVEIASDSFRAKCSTLGELLKYLLEEFPEENTYFVFTTANIQLAPHFFDSLDEEIADSNTAPLAVYFDHDYLDPDGERTAPYFKAEWSRNAFYNSCYVGPLCAFSRQLLSETPDALRDLPLDDVIPALLLGYDAHLTDRTVLHIPEVQYHVLEEVGFIPRAAPKHLVDALLPNYTSDEYGAVLPRLPDPSPLVSIIIPTKNNAGLLATCVESILQKSTYKNYEIVLLDNGTTEQDALNCLTRLGKRSNISVLRRPGPFNYSALNNAGVAAAAGEVLLLLNDDTEVISPDWIEQLIRYAMLDDIGCVGASLLYQDGRLQHAGVILGVHGVAGHAQRLANPKDPGYNGRLQYPQEYTAVTAACLAVRKSVFNTLGGLNEGKLAVAFNDIDLCLKARESGLANIWTPFAELFHYESVSRGQDVAPEKAARLAQEASYIMQRWPNYLNRDPAYNPNLSFNNTDFSLSTRYLLASSAGEDGHQANPSEDPYHDEPNIVRVSSVLKQDNGRRFQPRQRRPGLSIIILTLEKYELISQLLYALVAAKPELERLENIEIEIIVGDTGSTSERVDELYRELGDSIVLVRNMRYHFSRCNNELFESSASLDTVLFLNNDIEFDEPVYSLSEMYKCLKREPELGVIGPYMLYPTERLQHGGVDIFRSGPRRGFCYHPGHDTSFKAPAMGSRQRYPAVTGACLMMSAQLFESCGYFDEAYHAEAQDVDLCLKAHRYNKKSEVIYVGRIIHFENSTRKKGDSNPLDRARFVRKWATYTEIIFNED